MANWTIGLFMCGSWTHDNLRKLMCCLNSGDRAYNDPCLQMLCMLSCVFDQARYQRFAFYGHGPKFELQWGDLFGHVENDFLRRFLILHEMCWGQIAPIISVSRYAKGHTKWYRYRQRTWGDNPSRNIGAITNSHHGDAAKQCPKYSFDWIITLFFAGEYMIVCRGGVGLWDFHVVFLEGNCQATPVEPFQNKFGNCSGSLCAVHLPSTRHRWYVAGWLSQCSLSTLVATESRQKLVDKIVLQSQRRRKH